MIFLRPDDDLSALFLQRPVLPSGAVLVASDGSSQHVQTFRRAAWSVARLGQVVSRQLQGVDQGIYTAEAVAVCKAFIAASSVGRRLLLLCDNLAVVRRVKQLQRVATLPLWASGLWKAISLVSELHDIEWVPSHGKNPDWRPPLVGHNAEIWRRLNTLADEKAQNLASRLLRELDSWKQTFDGAVGWSTAALERQRAALRWLRNLLPSQESA